MRLDVFGHALSVFIHRVTTHHRGSVTILAVRPIHELEISAHSDRTGPFVFVRMRSSALEVRYTFTIEAEVAA